MMVVNDDKKEMIKSSGGNGEDKHKKGKKHNHYHHSTSKQRENKSKEEKEEEEEDIQCNVLPWIRLKFDNLCFILIGVWVYCAQQTTLSCNECRRRSSCYNQVYIKTIDECLPKTHRFCCGSCDIALSWTVLKNSYTNWTFFKFSFLLWGIFFFWLIHTSVIYFNGNEAQNVSELNHVLEKLCILVLTTAFFANVTFTIYMFEYMNLFAFNLKKDCGSEVITTPDLIITTKGHDNLPSSEKEEEDEKEEEEEEEEEGEEVDEEGYYISLY